MGNSKHSNDRWAHFKSSYGFPFEWGASSWLVRSSPDQAVRVRALAAGDIVFCSWARHFTLTVPLSTQEYKWVPANSWGNLTNCWGVTCDGLASRPRGVEILLAASCYKNRDKLRQLWASLGSKASLFHFLLRLKREFVRNLLAYCLPLGCIVWRHSDRLTEKLLCARNGNLLCRTKRCLRE